MKTLFLIILMLPVLQKLDAQLNLTAYNDMGRHNVSGGMFARAAMSAGYQSGKVSIVYGNQFNLKNHNPNAFSGAYLNTSRAFDIKGMTWKARALFMYNLITQHIHETNWGLALNSETKHLRYMFGTNFRTSHLTMKVTEDYGINSNTKLREKWNLMYLFSFYLKTLENRWNTGISITNVDNFQISQDTNPMVALNAKYRLKVPLTLFAESWYKPAGVFNISADSFGFYFRTGIQWELF